VIRRLTTIYIGAAAALLLAAQMLLPPVSDDKRRIWLLAEVRRELHERVHTNGEPPQEAMFRDASRIGQFLAAGGSQNSRALAEILSCFDQSSMLRLCEAKLVQFADGPLAPPVAEARAAIVERDASTLHAIAERLREQAPQKGSIKTDVAACLVLTASIVDRGRGVDFSQEATLWHTSFRS
jgi:hypothetical protein